MDDPKVLWGWPKTAVTHTLPACLPACLVTQRGTLLDSQRRKAAPSPGSGQRKDQGLGDRCPSHESWQGPSAVSASHRLPCSVPELRERGDPDRSPGRAEGHLDHAGEGRPPHTHRGPLQSHRAGHHPDRRSEKVRDFPCPGAAGLGRVSWRWPRQLWISEEGQVVSWTQTGQQCAE